MPRELTHWIVARRAISALRPINPTIAENLQKHPRAFFLGAIAHDAPYFLNFGRDIQFTRFAEVLHGGNGEDTFEPFRIMLQWIAANPTLQAEQKIQLRAFVAGMLTHALTDAVFHPSIFYITGDYYDPDSAKRGAARLRHREYEVALDASLVKLEPGLPSHSVSSFTSSGATLNFISDLLGSLAPLLPQQELLILNNRSLEVTWKRTLTDFALCQRAFSSSFAGFLMATAGTFLGGKPREYAGLFAGQSPYTPLSTSEVISYKNPITGDEHNATIVQLLDRSVAESVRYLSEWEILSDANMNSVPLLIQEKGPNLASGIVGTTYSDFHHFKN